MGTRCIETNCAFEGALGRERCFHHQSTEDALRAFWNDPDRVAKLAAKLDEMERQLDKAR